MSALLPSEVLSAAADLIEKPGAWLQDGLAHDAGGLAAKVTSDTAVCFCAEGAIARFVGDYCTTRYFDVENWLVRVIGKPIPCDWNDDPERTQAEVVTALRKASELAKAEGL